MSGRPIALIVGRGAASGAPIAAIDPQKIGACRGRLQYASPDLHNAMGVVRAFCKAARASFIAYARRGGRRAWCPRTPAAARSWRLSGSKATPMRTGLGKGREPLSEQEGGWPMLSGFHHQLRRVRWLSR